MKEFQLIPQEWGGLDRPPNTIAVNVSAKLIESKQRLDLLYQQLLEAGKLSHYEVGLYLDQRTPALANSEAVGITLPGLRLNSDGTVAKIYNEGVEHEQEILAAVASPPGEVELRTDWQGFGRAICYCCDPEYETLEAESATFTIVPERNFEIVRYYTGTSRHEAVIEFWTASGDDFDSALQFYEHTDDMYWENDYFELHFVRKPDNRWFIRSREHPDWEIARDSRSPAMLEADKQELQSEIRGCLETFAPALKSIPKFSEPLDVQLIDDLGPYYKNLVWASGNTHWAMRFTVY